MPSEPVIALAATPRDWAQRLHRHLADHGGGRIRATVLNMREAVEERYDVLIVDDSTSFLSARLVERLHGDGRAVLGLFDPVDPNGKGELIECGVDDALPADTETARLVAAVQQLATAKEHATVVVAATPAAPAPGLGDLMPRGDVIVVSGPGGSGATEVALGLAAALGAKRRVVLAELDEQRGALAPRLGLPPYPNLSSALEQVRRGGGSTLGALQPISASVACLVAGPAPRRAATPPPDDLTLLVEDLRRQADWVVVDAGATHRRLDAVAARLVAVGVESPLGVMRLAAWLRDDAPPQPHVLLNRCSGSVFRRYEVAAELTRATVPASLVTAPEDPRVGEAAWRGQFVRRGPFTRAMDRLAAAVVARAWEPAS